MDQEIKEEMFKKALDAQKNAYVPGVSIKMICPSSSV